MSELQWLIAIGVPLVDVVIALGCSAHAVLYKSDSRAAIGWCAVIWLVPFLGAALYVMLGVNRIRRKAHALRGDLPALTVDAAHACAPEALESSLGPDGDHLLPLARLVREVSGLPLLRGNAVEPLDGGDQAYPAMLAAIEAAERSVSLSTYIFDRDELGLRFVDALRSAVERGVEVRVLIDGVGANYSFPRVTRTLLQANVPTRAFLPTLWRFRYANLRNHRKLLVVDGRLGFTGGMNIRGGTASAGDLRASIQDLHFRVEGPVVEQLQAVFAQDWAFTSGEILAGEAWFPTLEPRGEVLARGVPDGPDEDFDELRLTLLGALACARERVRILTPYFVPDATILTALRVAALRGVEVDLILPAQNNLRLVQWASTALLWQILQRGCRVWCSPPPFDHTKLFVVDDRWSFIGSANWDARSLRLNFEFNLECYDSRLAGTLAALFEAKRSLSAPLTFADVEARSLPRRLRDGAARLLTPYL